MASLVAAGVNRGILEGDIPGSSPRLRSGTGVGDYGSSGLESSACNPPPCAAAEDT